LLSKIERQVFNTPSFEVVNRYYAAPIQPTRRVPQFQQHVWIRRGSVIGKFFGVLVNPCLVLGQMGALKIVSHAPITSGVVCEWQELPHRPFQQEWL
jgi:hypothetical protein